MNSMFKQITGFLIGIALFFLGLILTLTTGMQYQGQITGEGLAHILASVLISLLGLTMLILTAIYDTKETILQGKSS